MTAFRWTRRAQLSHDVPEIETWEYHRQPDGSVLSFEVQVSVGKPLDVAALKGTPLSEIREYAQRLAATAERLYRTAATAAPLARCTICEGVLAHAATEMRVFGVAYVRCPACRHVLVRERPDAAALDQLFVESEDHAATYVDPDAVAIRMTQVVHPKLDWGLAQYTHHRKAGPRRVVDVGAGGGHFLAAAIERGLMVEGFEASRSSRRFAQDTFGLTLRDDDFLNAAVSEADLVTMWGLLEYVAEPRVFLRKAREIMAPDGMLIVEVPRVDALATRVQATNAAVVARHMDPTSHINAFSDSSLCTALVEEGFAPVSAWYFGMDAWETLTQTALLLDDEKALSALAPLLSPLQASADAGRQCDDLVVAALPMTRA